MINPKFKRLSKLTPEDIKELTPFLNKIALQAKEETYSTKRRKSPFPDIIDTIAVHGISAFNGWSDGNNYLPNFFDFSSLSFKDRGKAVTAAENRDWETLKNILGL